MEFKIIMTNRYHKTALLLTLLAAFSGSSYATESESAEPSKLQPCPTSPNCVSSDSRTEQHQIAVIEPKTSLDKSWVAIVSYIQQTPRFALVEQQDNYLKAEATTLIMRFTDDVEFEKRPADNVIAVRSASRVGHSDLGANRTRVEEIRSFLSTQDQ